MTVRDTDNKITHRGEFDFSSVRQRIDRVYATCRAASLVKIELPCPGDRRRIEKKSARLLYPTTLDIPTHMGVISKRNLTLFRRACFRFPPFCLFARIRCTLCRATILAKRAREARGEKRSNGTFREKHTRRV